MTEHQPSQETLERLDMAKYLLEHTIETPEAVAKEAGFPSRDGMYMAFRRHEDEGLTPKQYRQQHQSVETLKQNTEIPLTTFMNPQQKTLERLEKAVPLIKYTDQKITDIAKEVGCQNHSDLSLAVKHYYGVSPNQLRKQHDNRNLKIEWAQFLAQNTELKGGEIAEKLDMSKSGLARDFKRHTDQTMTQFGKEDLPYSVLKARNLMVETSMRLQPIAQRANFFGDHILKEHFETNSKKAGELSIEEYRNHLKQWRAERLLRRTERGEKLIAEDVGFENVEDFRSFFKEGKGKLPLEYRHAHNGIKALQQMYTYA